MKVGGFGLMRLSKIAPDKVKLMNHEAIVDTFSYYTAPELHRNEVFDMSVDAYAFGFILYEMVEGLPNMESSTVITRCEGMRPSLKGKLKGYPADFKALIEECWETHPMARPTFSEMIVRLDKIYAHCMKQGAWKESLKIWSVSRRLEGFQAQNPKKDEYIVVAEQYRTVLLLIQISEH